MTDETTSTNKTTEEQNKSSSGSASVFPSVIAFLALFVAGAGFYFSFQTSEQGKQFASTISEHSSQFAEFATKEQIQNVLSKQEQELLQLQNSVSNLQLKSQQDETAWVLSEVQYLVKLANFNLMYDANVEVARQILQIADRRVQSLPATTMANVRAALANDLAKLDAIKKVDREGIVLRLSALSDMVSELPLTDHQADLMKASAQQEASVVANTADWRSKIQNSLASLKNAVVIRRLDQPLTPLLSPEQHANLIENIQLKLSFASWAVLHRNQSLFQHSLEQAQKWIKANLKDTDATKALLSGVEQLSQINVAPSLPNLNASMAAIQQAINAKARPSVVEPSLQRQIQPRIQHQIQPQQQMQPQPQIQPQHDEQQMPAHKPHKRGYEPKVFSS